MRDGDWTCASCGRHVYGCRIECKCGQPKPFAGLAAAAAAANAAAAAAHGNGDACCSDAYGGAMGGGMGGAMGGGMGGMPQQGMPGPPPQQQYMMQPQQQPPGGGAMAGMMGVSSSCFGRHLCTLRGFTLHALHPAHPAHPDPCALHSTPPRLPKQLRCRRFWRLWRQLVQPRLHLQLQRRHGRWWRARRRA